MIIKKARFVTSMAEFRNYPMQGLPEIAMAGKSNVGKSSLINSLARNGKLARTSSDPGKTRLINFYLLNEAFFLVDLPGYGFARAPKSEREKWGNMIEGYLEHSPNLKHVLQLVDIRHTPTQDDVMMIEYLRHYDIPFTVIATKADKLSKAQCSRSIPVICRTLVVQPWEILLYSAPKGIGREAVLKKLDDIIAPEEASIPEPDGNPKLEDE